MWFYRYMYTYTHVCCYLKLFVLSIECMYVCNIMLATIVGIMSLLFYCLLYLFVFLFFFFFCFNFVLFSASLLVVWAHDIAITLIEIQLAIVFIVPFFSQKSSLQFLWLERTKLRIIIYDMEHTTNDKKLWDDDTKKMKESKMQF